MKNRYRACLFFCYDPRARLVCRALLFLCALLWTGHVFAANDVLEGTMNDVNATLQGNGRKWLYVIEGISALIAYRSTKNVYVLGSVIAVAIFINVLVALSR